MLAELFLPPWKQQMAPEKKSEETSRSRQLRQVAASWPTPLSQEQSVRLLLDKLRGTRQKTVSLTAEEARETVISVPRNSNFSLHITESCLMSHLPTGEDRKVPAAAEICTTVPSRCCWSFKEKKQFRKATKCFKTLNKSWSSEYSWTISYKLFLPWS